MDVLNIGSDTRVTGRRVVVIGAGVIGAAIGLECARRGWSTVVLERLHAPGHGSTAASSAVVRFPYSTFAGTAMAYEGVRYWEGWADHLGLPAGRPLARFVRCGMLFFDDPSGLARASVDLLEQVGVEYEWLSLDELRDRFPHLSTGSWHPPTLPHDPAFFADPAGVLGGALYTAEAGYVTDPQLAAHNLAEAAELAGAQVLCGAEVVGIDRDTAGSMTISLGDGRTLTGDVVVNAAGPHSSRVNAMAGALDGMAVVTRPLRQQVERVPAPSALTPVVERHPVTADLDGGIYFRPDGPGLLVGGVEAECDPLVWLDDPDEVDLDLRADEWETHTLRLARRIPLLGVPHERQGVVGVYDVSDDWLPVLDRTDVPGYYVAIGSSGNQFKNAAVIGHCMAELVDAVESGHDHDRDPVVVIGRHRGLPIDLGTFSRRRRCDGVVRSVLG